MIGIHCGKASEAQPRLISMAFYHWLQLYDGEMNRANSESARDARSEKVNLRTPSVADKNSIIQCTTSETS